MPPPKNIEIPERTETSSFASFLGFYLKFATKFPLSARLYYKKEDINFPIDDFTFPILNFPHLDNNIPTCHSYPVLILQNRYTGAWSLYSDFLQRHRFLCP